MRENRLSGSEGGGAGIQTGPPYPYHSQGRKPLKQQRKIVLAAERRQ